jgi:hypothetical protein
LRGQLRRDGRPVRSTGEKRVRLPVVELEPRGRTHQLLRPLRVRHVRQADRDLIAALGRDLRLRHAELVRALAHHVDRALEGRLRHGGRLRRRLALVHELHAALQVKPEERLLGRDHDRRRRDQTGDQEQDEEVALTIGHRLRRMLVAPGRGLAVSGRWPV